MLTSPQHLQNLMSEMADKNVCPTTVNSGFKSPSMTEPRLHIHRRNLPHWTLEGSTYFITYRLASGTLAPPEQQLVFDHIRAGHGKFYSLAAVVVMPDHVHLLLKPKPEYTLSRIMKGIKGVSAEWHCRRRNSCHFLGVICEESISQHLAGFLHEGVAVAVAPVGRFGPTGVPWHKRFAGTRSSVPEPLPAAPREAVLSIRETPLDCG